MIDRPVGKHHICILTDDVRLTYCFLSCVVCLMPFMYRSTLAELATTVEIVTPWRSFPMPRLPNTEHTPTLPADLVPWRTKSRQRFTHGVP